MNMRGFVLSADALFAIFLTAVFIVAIFNVVREDAHPSVKDTFGQDVARLVCEGVSPDQVFTHEQVCGYISVNGNSLLMNGITGFFNADSVFSPCYFFLGNPERSFFFICSFYIKNLLN